MGAASLTFKEQQGLTYMQIKGTGLANTCPLLDDASDKVDVPAGEYQIEKFCLEPTGIEVREEPGGERVPFLFSVKDLNASGNLESFTGDFNVPSGLVMTHHGGSGGWGGAARAAPAPPRPDRECNLR